MKLLLDTHIWIWSVLTPERVTSQVARALKDSDNELWLSPISTWELILLVERDRIDLKSDFDTWRTAALATLPLTEAPLTHEVALAIREVDLPHRDPADRFLAATARYYELTLVTADERMLAGKGFRKLANRL